jgi:hypothetical protein
MYNAHDFFRGTMLDTEDYDGGITTYVGALRAAVQNLRDAAPYARIILCTPHYSQFFDEDGTYLGDGNILSNTYGTLFDYKGKLEYVAKEQRTLFVNAYQDLGIDGHSAAKFLDNGVYLSDKGRVLYADYLSKMILKYEETRDN